VNTDQIAEVLNPEAEFPVLFLCEHAGNRLPADVMPYLGMDNDFIDSYHGYDIGIPHVVRRVAHRLNATCIMGVYSRLLVDLNREAAAPDVIHDHDDGIIIPANQCLSKEDVQERLKKYHEPFHELCESHIERLQGRYQNPAVFSFHSFPRHQTGYDEPFPWNFTIHYNKSYGLAEIMREFFSSKYPEVKFGDNDPYDLSKPKGLRSFMMHGQERGLANLLIEIPNDQMRDPDGIEHWTNICVEVLKTLPAKLEIKPRNGRIVSENMHLSL
jgi:predicted N-formylglutamate amidohydrolase